jgi:arabinofuranosyltransferase
LGRTLSTWLDKPARRWFLLFLLTILLLLGRVVQLDGPYVLLDDAFISFRYARNLANGLGLVFNAGERVEGYTNFLWTLLLAASYKLGTDIVLASQALALLAAVGTLFLLALLGKHVFADRDQPFLWIAIPVVLFAAFGSQARYVVSGMETLLFTFLVTLAIYAFLYHGPSFLGGVAFALAAMTRPEGVMYFALAAGYAIVAPRLAGEQRPRLKGIGSLVAGFLLLYGSYFLWRTGYYGYLLPNTFYAKASGFQWLRLQRGWQILLQVVSSSSLLPVLIPAVFALFPLRRDRPWPFFALMVGATIVYFCFVGGDFVVWFGPRFLMPILPVLLLLAAEGLRRLSGVRFVPGRQRRTVQLALAVFLFVNAVWASWPTAFLSKGVVSGLLQKGASILAGYPLGAFSVQMQGWAEMGKWIAANTPPEATIATDAAGLVPFYSQRTTIDMFGLTDLHIAHLPLPLTADSIVAHEKYDPGYVLERGPDYIFSSWLDTQGNAVSAGLSSVEPEFSARYELIAVAKVRNGAPSDGRWILVTDSYWPDLYEQGYLAGLFRRRDLPSY